jgi:hypothetical protein
VSKESKWEIAIGSNLYFSGSLQISIGALALASEKMQAAMSQAKISLCLVGA